MIHWGWSGMSHDAALAVFDDDKLLFAAHSERYTRVKNEKNLCQGLIDEALTFGRPDNVHFYENTFLKKLRQVKSKQWNLLKKESPRKHMAQFGIDKYQHTTTHHRAHAAAGYFTSGFDSATILVIDSIGEFDTLSVWEGKGKRLRKRQSQGYPHSIGLWYSAMTQRLGLKPQEHEYILMGMAALGDPDKYYDIIMEDFFEEDPSNTHQLKVKFKRDLHRGCLDWRPDLNTVPDLVDVAAAVQKIYEKIFHNLLTEIYLSKLPTNLVLMGGCALNCVANSIAIQMPFISWEPHLKGTWEYSPHHIDDENTQPQPYFDNVWIMPNPGDAGSAIGAVLAHTKTHIDFTTANLGHNIEGEYPVDQIINEIIQHKITAVAAGKAEFGPRALGNRSILADPRGLYVKNRVNRIKHREEFRPFAPIILESCVAEYFNVAEDFKSPYMQYTVKCRRPDLYPAIVHYDGTSRVQTVNEKDNPEVYALLMKWYKITGCPMLLNTSLNIKGEPLVNTLEDAQRWELKYRVTVCTPTRGK